MAKGITTESIEKYQRVILRGPTSTNPLWQSSTTKPLVSFNPLVIRDTFFPSSDVKKVANVVNNRPKGQTVAECLKALRKKFD